MDRTALIKPCPFCGSGDQYAGPASALSYHVLCMSCGGRGPEIYLPDTWEGEGSVVDWCMKKAVGGWNKRPNDIDQEELLNAIAGD